MMEGLFTWCSMYMHVNGIPGVCLIQIIIEQYCSKVLNMRSIVIRVFLCFQCTYFEMDFFVFGAHCVP